MSVFIKDFDRPTMCWSCPMFCPYTGICNITKTFPAPKIDSDGIHSGCPIKTITKPHGNLIDADKLKSHLIDVWNSHMCDSYNVSDMMRDLSDFEVIIEEEY